MWIETSNEVYAVIFAKHRKQLKQRKMKSKKIGKLSFLFIAKT